MENLKKQVMGWFQEFFDKNYKSGATKIPPHQHNGVDNLKIQSSSIAGGIVTQIIAGTNVTISPGTGTGAVTVNSSGGGGGSPGGNNTDVQFNDSGSFGGTDKFTYVDSDPINSEPLLTIDSGDGTGGFGSQISGGTSNLNILTADSSGTDSGNIAILAGGNSVNIPGSILINGGLSSADASSTTSGGSVGIIGGSSNYLGGQVTLNGGNGLIPGTSASGFVQINGGNDGGGRTVGGSIQVDGADTSTSSSFGDIIIMSGYNSFLSSGGGVISFNGGLNPPNISVGSITPTRGPWGIIFIGDATGTPSTPSGGGCLYSSSGALHWLGSSGTDTTIAPA